MQQRPATVAVAAPVASRARDAWRRVLLSDYLVPAVTVLYFLALLPFVPEDAEGMDAVLAALGGP